MPYSPFFSLDCNKKAVSTKSHIGRVSYGIQLVERKPGTP